MSPRSHSNVSSFSTTEETPKLPTMEGKIDTFTVSKKGIIPQHASSSDANSKTSVDLKSNSDSSLNLGSNTCSSRTSSSEENLAKNEKLNVNVNQSENESIPLQLGPHQPKNQREVDRRSIYVSNIPFKISPWQLKEIFCKGNQQVDGCGENAVNRVTIVCDRVTGLPKGFAYIELAEEKLMKKALKFNGTEVDGRVIGADRKRTNIPGLISDDEDESTPHLKSHEHNYNNDIDEYKNSINTHSHNNSNQKRYNNQKGNNYPNINNKLHSKNHDNYKNYNNYGNNNNNNNQNNNYNSINNRYNNEWDNNRQVNRHNRQHFDYAPSSMESGNGYNKSNMYYEDYDNNNYSNNYNHNITCNSGNAGYNTYGYNNNNNNNNNYNHNYNYNDTYNHNNNGYGNNYAPRAQYNTYSKQGTPTAKPRHYIETPVHVPASSRDTSRSQAPKERICSSFKPEDHDHNDEDNIDEGYLGEIDRRYSSSEDVEAEGDGSSINLNESGKESRSSASTDSIIGTDDYKIAFQKKDGSDGRGSDIEAGVNEDPDDVCSIVNISPPDSTSTSTPGRERMDSIAEESTGGYQGYYNSYHDDNNRRNYRGNYRGNFRGGYRGNNSRGSRGSFRGGYRGGSRGGSRGGFRGGFNRSSYNTKYGHSEATPTTDSSLNMPLRGKHVKLVIDENHYLTPSSRVGVYNQ
jgi:RNA recognition motif-containing protein